MAGGEAESAEGREGEPDVERNGREERQKRGCREGSPNNREEKG